jgi:probable rRNA maturation factor
MTVSRRAALDIDVIVASKRWPGQAKRAKTVVRRAVRKAATAARCTRASELAIVLTDDSRIRLLNRNWRGFDAATNVLSFPTKNGGDKRHLGDIVLAFETIAREARAEHKPFAHHLAHLAVHGFLHLVGHDHENDLDAARMESAERRILKALGIPDPYRTAERRTEKRPASQRIRA